MENLTFKWVAGWYFPFARCIILANLQVPGDEHPGHLFGGKEPLTEEYLIFQPLSNFEAQQAL
ncbi:hypothetical protein DCC81_02835 [Chitinophaga parva]|uniref:Uncharacterized protein n=1 Tax=Chitinophaga parva TaxID=2169414 RepID=A0A2T7BL91_9BACT|nr:hypothetical protein DCC81_02835 [Chitinophaga parva]